MGLSGRSSVLYAPLGDDGFEIDMRAVRIIGQEIIDEVFDAAGALLADRDDKVKVLILSGPFLQVDFSLQQRHKDHLHRDVAAMSWVVQSASHYSEARKFVDESQKIVPTKMFLTELEGRSWLDDQQI